MDVSDNQRTSARESGTPAHFQEKPQSRLSGGMILLILLLFGLWFTGAVAINRLHGQVKDLESSLSETRSSLSAAHAEVEILQDELESKAGREELPVIHTTDANQIIKAIAHRGFSSEAPENTIPAFLLAQDKGFAYIETDIRFTSDGVPVCLHDETVNRTSNGSGAIAGMTLAEARRLDFGSWKGEAYAGTTIPTAEDFLRLCRAMGIHPYLELKIGSQAEIRDLMLLVKSFGMEDDVTWLSFSYELLRYVEHYDPTARLGLLAYQVDTDVLAQASWLSMASNRVFLDSASCTDAECQLCLERGIPLEAWTVDDSDAVVAMNPYVSGVTSNSLIAGQVLSEAYLGAAS